MSIVSRRLFLGWMALAVLMAGCSSPHIENSLAARPEQVDLSEARDIISAYRRGHGLSALALDPALDQAAAAQAMAMARTDTLSHTVAGSLGERLGVAHVPNMTAAENVSAGYSSLADAIAGWRRSPPHNANLLDPDVRRMGIGSAYVQNSKYHVYWSLILTN